MYNQFCISDIKEKASAVVWMTLRFMMTILVLVASIDGISQWAGGAPEVCCCRHWPLSASPPLPRATGTVKHTTPRVRTSPEEHPPAD